MTLKRVAAELERLGLLMQQDKSLTSVVSLVTGESLRTSWWSHPRAKEIFTILRRLEEVSLATKLVAGKVTLVHRRLWPALLTVATIGEPWQSAVAKEVHTESGKHEIVYEPWPVWAAREGVVPMPDLTAAREIGRAHV